jgi:hypothetical protein
VLGGSSDAAARRAARLADGFIPSSAEPFGTYLAELERLGRPAPDLGKLIPLPSVTLVHPEPDVGWGLIAEYCLLEATTYARWLRDGRGGTGPYEPVDSIDELRATGQYSVVTPNECADLVRTHGGVMLHPLVGGLAPEVATASLALIEHEVLPAVRG